MYFTQNTLYIPKKLIHQSIPYLIYAIIVLAFLHQKPLIATEYSPAIHIFNTKEDLGEACARKMADLIKKNNKEGGVTVLGLATGNTPIPVYKAFKGIVQKEDIDLSKVITFNLDEYCGLPPSHPGSYRSFMLLNFFNELLASPTHPHGIKLENIHIPNGYAQKNEHLTSEEQFALNKHFPNRQSSPTLSDEEMSWILSERAKKYDELIQDKGPIQLQILGIGSNGHIGFAEPGSSFEGRTMLVKLSEGTRKDNATFFADNIIDVPQYAITMGIGTISQSKEIILLATGGKKANIVEKALYMPISSETPATALRLHPDVIFLLDKDAASKINSRQTVRYHNAQILKDHELKVGEIWVANGKIIAPQHSADHEIDVQGLILAPGYIDLQINGGFGIDFSTEAEKVQVVACCLPQYGVTSFLPTLISTDKKHYSELIPHLKPRQGGESGSNILGAHLEGPFFNPKQYGAHNPLMIREFDEPLESFYGDLDGVKIVTLAPEIQGGLATIRYLKEKGIVVSAGHTSASYDEAKAAFNAGVSMATHLFNAMTPLHHRSPGIVGAVLTNDSIHYSVIADGLHLHPVTLDLAWRTNPKGLILVTDAIEALGLPPGHYHLGTMEVDVQQGQAYVSGTQKIAGSVLSMDEAVRNFHAATKNSIVDAIEAASLKPAQILGIQDHKGHLNEGADADFIILDDGLYVQACFISGQLAWKKP